MASYGYGPPPPPPSQAPSGYGQQYQTPYGGQDHPRRGRGGGYYSGGRGGGGGGSDRSAASGYAYNSQGPQGQQQYGQQGPYGSGAAHPPQGAYAPPPQPLSHPQQPRQPQGQQQWAPAHDPAAHGHRAQHPPPPTQGYHPNFAPQMYQQQPPPSHSHSPPQHHQQPPPNAATAVYGQQPPYGAPPAPAAQQSYGHQYSHARPGQQSHGSPNQPWAPPPGGRGSHTGGHYGGRGGRGGGGSKTQMMGPPIRLGFESGSPHDGHGPAAPVSSGYPPPQPHVPYGAVQGGPVPPPPPPGPAGYAAPAPYQAYPPPGPPQYYDPYYTQNNRPYPGGGRGGHQGGSFRGGRPHLGGDKMRHHNKKQGGPGPHGGVGSNAAPTSQHQKPDASPAGKKKKRKTNTLGLTPGEESDDDEMDEESKLVQLIGPDAPNPVDIDSWIAERRKNFPTKARLQAKLAESGASGEDAEAENAKAGGGNDSVSGGGGKGSSAGLTALERQQMKAEKLRRQLEKVESSIKRKREQQDEGDEMRGPGGDAGNGESDDEVSSVDIKSEDDDAPPESLPIRTETAKGKKTSSSEVVTGTTTAEAAAAAAKSNVIPPAAKKADQSKHCKYYSTGGTCAKKGRCRFVHDQAVREAALMERERNGGRMTLQQRLILNDKDQEDLTIVKTLQYLKEKGIMKDSAVTPAAAPVAPAAPTAKAGDLSSVSSPQQTSTDAVASEAEQPHQYHGGSPANGPANGSTATLNGAPRMRYEGWDLSGFGNKGAKSDDP